MEDDDDWRELLKLDKQYFESPKEERERMRRDFERAINKVAPGLLEKAGVRFHNGDYLKDMVDQCMQRVLARPDLTSYGRTNTIEDADDFKVLFEWVRKLPPKLAALIYAMNTATLFIGMRSGHDPDAVEELRARARRDNSLNAAKTAKKTRRTAHANDLIREIAKDYPEFHDAEIVEEVPKRWRLERLPCLKPRRLGDLVRAWRKGSDGLPRPTGRRTYPLKRAQGRARAR
jgi:hypothetical protein